ncbi:hypothetical protein BKE38_01790 [Pseudoroseomonas deserti]|uniref:Uncharacterized protein n=1 Tax=Teichococcus deserti TaxID=1817963 RepID=A0A1V2H8W1_9PROT|nr:hypothetical protein [Pseudoroseomonas deserti]ONG58789.1 hypothetical protein BKE38_01790 [Pseudoroseomonas deserti]
MDEPPVVTLLPAGGCVGDWRGWRLDMHCGCCVTQWSINRMIEQQRLPAWQLISVAVARLRCRQCGERVHSATFRDREGTGVHGIVHHRTGILVPVLEDLLQG